ncbi:MAG TPA: glycosyltransferase [Pyrinomonadaceae bacterium]|nr:glycosyltransferase [Pyrinomonadaceae bacterium]
MKLIVSHLEAVRTYVTRELYYIQHDLITNHGWRHIEANYLWQRAGSLEYKLRAVLGELPETIIFWEAYEVVLKHARQMQRLKCRKFFFADDLHWWNRRMREIRVVVFALSDAVLSPYVYRWTSLYPELASKRLVWVPHSASTDFTLPFNADAENAIFLSGAINEAYPLRRQMLQLHREGSYAIKYHRHPGYYCGYDYQRDARIGRGYAEKIRECRVGFADSVSPYAYIVAKFFEIPATGALLLADDTGGQQLKRLAFEPGRHYVPVSQKNLKAQIEYVLAERNHDELDQIRRNGQRLVHEQHKTSDRARFINAVCAA